MPKIFASASKNNTLKDKHFKKIEIQRPSNETETTLNDNSFGDFTFDNFYGVQIEKISTNAFGNSSTTIYNFFCSYCVLTYSPSNYNIWATLSQLNKLRSVQVGLNVKEIPSNAITPINQQTSNLTFLVFSSRQDLTIRTNAFHNLKHLIELRIYSTKISKVQRGAFNFSKGEDDILLYFNQLNMTGNSFEEGSFDGNKGTLKIRFLYSDIDYIPENSFKSLLNKTESEIKFLSGSTIDCDHCKNQWLINQKQEKVKTPYCRNNDDNKTLFDEEIQSKLKLKCK